MLEEADVCWGGTNPDSAAAHAARATGRKHGRLLGMVMKLAGGDGTDDSVKQFGEKHGMEPKDAAEFHANHIRLPLPGTATRRAQRAAAGHPAGPATSPGSSSRARSTCSATTTRSWSSASASCPALWVDSDDVTIPGFGDELPPAALAVARQRRLRHLDRRAQGLRLHGSPQGSSGWPSGDEVERFCARAVEVADAL